MRVLFAWELGGGLGHVARLAPWMRQFAVRGVTPVLAVRDLNVMAQAPEFGAVEVVQAPLLLHGPLLPGFEPRTYPELLLDAGYGNPATLGALVGAWRTLLRLAAVDALVADYAPTAMLAARIAGLPVMQIGDGFTIPPAGELAASGVSEPSTGPARKLSALERVLDCVKRVLDLAGGRPLDSLAELARGSLNVLATYPELDHYRGSLREDAFAGHFDNPGGDSTPWRPVPGPRVLAYLKPTAGHFEVVVDTLQRLPVQTRIFASGLVRSDDSVSGAGLSWSATPFAFSRLAAGADLVVSHAGHGAACGALLAGKPLCMLPLFHEQLLTARNVESLGAGSLAMPGLATRQLRRIVRRAIEDPAMRSAAAGFAARYATHAGGTAVRLAETTDRFLALVKQARAA